MGKNDLDIQYVTFSILVYTDLPKILQYHNCIQQLNNDVLDYNISKNNNLMLIIRGVNFFRSVKQLLKGSEDTFFGSANIFAY